LKAGNESDNGGSCHIFHTLLTTLFSPFKNTHPDQLLHPRTIWGPAQTGNVRWCKRQFTPN